MKRILVTGGAGFIGCHLCKELLARGYEVLSLDNLATSWMPNLDPLIAAPGFRLISCDVAHVPLDLEVEEIYNLACPASPPHYQADPIWTWETSALGIHRILTLAHACGAKVLQASTSEVYGDPLIHPQAEGYFGNVHTTGPRACYDEGKRAAETLCADWTRQRGDPVQIARIFNTYGPGMHPKDGRVVSNFVRQALRSEPLTIYGDGQQTRSFCFVSDLVEGLVRLMERPTQFLGPVNLGNPGEFTMLELAELIRDVAGSGSRIEHRPLPIDDPKMRRPVIDKAIEHLGWEPKVALVDGITQMVAWARKTGWMNV